jgi:thiamine pyrophosphokinase
VLLVPGSDEPVVIEGPRVATDNTHGTGCTLSSAVACGLAEGLSVEDAVRRAKAYLTDCLRAGLDLGSGSGPVDHMVRLRSCPEARAAVRADGAEKPAQACADARSAVPGRRTHVLVVGGSPERPPRDLLRALELQSDLVVVCDGGADACRAAGVRVDVLVGDGDSASDAGLAYARASAGTVLAFPQDKDDVDLGLALDWVRANVPVPCDVTLTGVTGGRTDHALAVLGLLGRNADLCPSVEEDGVSMRLLSPAGQPRWGLGASGVGRTLSVLALAGEAVVSEEGMRWNLVRGRLKPLDDLGVSNVVEQPGAAVTVHEGAALATLLRDPVVKAR